MRTTIEIDDVLLQDVMNTIKTTSKRRAIDSALREFLRVRRQRELIELIGNYDEFALTLKDLRQMRRDG